VFVEDEKVCDFVCSASIGNLLHDIVSSVDAVRIGKDESHFLSIQGNK
jgi:hypothetical protein